MESTRSHPVRDFLLVATLALGVRVLTFQLFPLDWNWDSYHHWQISWLSLNVGFPLGRLWDLNGCEYYWGIFPHLVEASLLGILNTASIVPFRFLNAGLGSCNACLVLLIGVRHFGARVGAWSGVLFAVFPVAAIFDILGLQDTIALILLLSSLYVLDERPFWSGILLALAGQSRTEFFLVSTLLVFWVCAAERLPTRRQPMLIGWLGITGLAVWFTFNQTGNPFYGLYWSLISVFTGGRPTTDSSFLSQMFNWIFWKLEVWPTKPTGIAILLATAACFGYFILTMFRRPKNYQIVYLLATSVFTAPIFLTYVGSDMRSLLIMLRSIVPIVALGLPFMVAFTLKLASKGEGRKAMLILLVIFSLGLPLAYCAYEPFEAEAKTTFAIADKAATLYYGGTIVCDYPMMNYRIEDKLDINPRLFIGNHYAPQYLGVVEPMEYAKWLYHNRVMVWVRYGADAEEVYGALAKASPNILRFAFEDSGIGIFVVNNQELSRVLS